MNKVKLKLIVGSIIIILTMIVVYTETKVRWIEMLPRPLQLSIAIFFFPLGGIWWFIVMYCFLSSIYDIKREETKQNEKLPNKSA